VAPNYQEHLTESMKSLSLSSKFSRSRGRLRGERGNRSIVVESEIKTRRLTAWAQPALRMPPNNEPNAAGSDTASNDPQAMTSSEDAPSHSSSRKTQLKHQVTNLEEELRESKDELARLLDGAGFISSPEDVIQKHIKMLHNYNEIRDTGLALIGIVADIEKSTTDKILSQFGFTTKD